MTSNLENQDFFAMGAIPAEHEDPSEVKVVLSGDFFNTLIGCDAITGRRDFNQVKKRFSWKQNNQT